VRHFAALAIALYFVMPLRADLKEIAAEANLEKRAEKALANAEVSLKTAEDSYLSKGDLKDTSAALDELADSVRLAYASLAETHKNPSKSPKYFKRAEIKTRELLRRLEDFRQQMGVDDRGVTDKARAVVQKVHEDLLAGIMSGKKPKEPRP